MILAHGKPGRWRGPLLISLAAHLVVGAAVYLLPPESNTPATPTATLRNVGFGMERRPPKTRHTGEEASEPSALEGEATLRNPLLFGPVLDHGAASAAAPAKIGDGAGKGGGSGVGSGAGKGVSFFHVGVKAKKIVYVLDASSSMGKDGLWERASNEVIASLDRLPDDAVFQIIVYNSRARFLLPASPGWLSYRDTKEAVSAALRNLAPEGATMHAPAFNLALAKRPEVIFFLTDADDLTLPLLAQIATWNRCGAAIHAFELNRRGAPRPGTPMQLLAQQHRGEYRAVPRAGSVP